MIALLGFVLAVLVAPFKLKSRLETENAVLRHQLIVLRRKVHGRVRLTNNDRWFFIQPYRWFPLILNVLTIIWPETLVRLHRAGFRRYSLAGGGGGGAGGGAAISSFFDIYTEVSTDVGGSWGPATNGPAHMELRRISPPYPFTNNLLPVLVGQYVSPQQWHASYANGIVITNVIHRQFTAAITPPPPGITVSHTFGSQVEMELSTDGGLYLSSGDRPGDRDRSRSPAG